MPSDLYGTCVLSMWDGGKEFHTADQTAAFVDWRAVESHIRAVMFENRNREAVGVFARCLQPQWCGGVDVHTLLLDNMSCEDGHFSLSDNDARRVWQWKEDGLLLGIWHSHPNGRREPSEPDWRGHPHGVPMYIISVESHDEMIVMRYDDDDRPGQCNYE